MKNWEDDDTEEYCSSRQDLVDAVSVAERHRHRDRSGKFLRRVQGAGVREFPARVPGRPHAESRRAVQRRDQVQGVPRPRACARRGAHRDRPLCAGAQERRPLPTAQGGGRNQGSELFPPSPHPEPADTHALSPGQALQTRGARDRRASAGCPTTTRRTPPASASSASGRSASSSSVTCRRSRAQWSRPRARPSVVTKD